MVQGISGVCLLRREILDPGRDGVRLWRFVKDKYKKAQGFPSRSFQYMDMKTRAQGPTIFSLQCLLALVGLHPASSHAALSRPRWSPSQQPQLPPAH